MRVKSCVCTTWMNQMIFLHLNVVFNFQRHFEILSLLELRSSLIATFENTDYLKSKTLYFFNFTNKVVLVFVQSEGNSAIFLSSLVDYIQKWQKAVNVDDDACTRTATIVWLSYVDEKKSFLIKLNTEGYSRNKNYIQKNFYFCYFLSATFSCSLVLFIK